MCKLYANAIKLHSKKRTRLAILFVIILPALFLCIQPDIVIANSQAIADIVPIANWENMVFDYSTKSDQPSILDKLPLMQKSASLSYHHFEPYYLSGTQRKILYIHDIYQVNLVLPIHLNKHDIGLTYNISQLENDFLYENLSTQNRFTFAEKRTEQTLTIAHNIHDFDLRWGTELKWKHQSNRTFFEPKIALSWGNLARVKLNIEVYQKIIDNSYRWNYSTDSTLIKNSNKINGSFISMRIGEQFGHQLLFSTENRERLKYRDGNSIDYTVFQTGTERSFSVYLQNRNPKELNYQIGGQHTEHSGELEIYRDDRRISQVSGMNSQFERWGGSIENTMTRHISWKAHTEYHYLKSTGSGWLIIESLPESFQNVFFDDSFYFTMLKHKGIFFNGEISKRFRYLQPILNVSYLYSEPDIQIRDFPVEGNPEIRKNELPVNSFGAGLLALRARFVYNRYNLDIEGSKMFLIHADFKDEAFSEEDSSLNNGWQIMSKVSLAF